MPKAAYSGFVLGMLLAGIVSLSLLFAAPPGSGRTRPKEDGKSRGIVVPPPKTIKAVVPHDAGNFIDGQYWALIIGIDEYLDLDAGMQLTAARKSAAAVARLLTERYGFSKDRMIELYDEDASLLGIINALYELESRLSDKDSLLIYYAGLGGYANARPGSGPTEKTGYWIPSDGEKDNTAYYLFNSDVKDFLVSIPARHILMVVDSSFSDSLMVTTRKTDSGRVGARDLYVKKSRWILSSGGPRPMPDPTDPFKEGYSAFAWRFIRVLEGNTHAYLPARDIVGPLTIKRSQEQPGPPIRSAPVLAAGDDGGQFVLWLRKEQQKGAGPEQAPIPFEEKEQGALQEPAGKTEKAAQREEPAPKVARVRPFAAPPQASREITGKDGVPMVLVPAGDFTMGSEEEKPSHRVYLDAFYLDKYELTTSRYAQFLKATRRNPPDHWNEVNMTAHRDRPVIGVDWHDADAYCRWSGKRLPTEAEWEKAARGTDGRAYPWGNEQPTSRNANFGKCCDWKGYASLAPVGSLEAGKSPLGVADMAGNVYEWVADWYGERYYQNSPYRNPKGPPAGEYKVLRGGSWHSPSKQDVRATLRIWDVPTAQTGAIGFRCAQDVPK